MNLLQQFVDFLTNKKGKLSLLTVKNYKADVGQFISWFEKEFRSPFNPSIITLQILEQYKKARTLSPISIQRHISSLRKFFSFLKEKGVPSYDPFEKRTLSAVALAEADPWRLRNFKSFLYDHKKSNLTIKNYINDIKSFFEWFAEVSLTKYAWIVTERNLLEKINYSIVEEYKQRLIAAEFSPATINRKLSSLRNYISWAESQNLIFSGHPELVSGSPANRQASLRSNEILNERSAQRGIQHETEETTHSSFPPLRLIQKSTSAVSLLFDIFFILPIAKTLENTQYLFWKTTGKKVFKKSVIPNSFRDPRQLGKEMLKQVQHDKVSNIQKGFYAPLNTSTRYLPPHKRLWHHIRYSRPKWYKRYHSYSFTHYFHFSILMILSCAVGFGIYNSLFADLQKQDNILAAVTTAPPRILSFQGRLTDPSNNPIASATSIIFSMYDNETASSALWQETNLVTPDTDGRFSATLGRNTPIPDTLFSQNPQLFLGIKVGNSAELRPRQQLATVPFASNSETLQGLEPITNTTKTSNVVMALDSSGNLTIADSKAHTFQAIGGQFVLSGSVLSLVTTPGTNSNVIISPDGLGKIDLQKPAQNSQGDLQLEDNVTITATTSGAALNINQNSTGKLIDASVNGTSKFSVGNDGTLTFGGDLAVNGGDLTSTATTFNLMNSTVTTLNLGGAATNLVLGATTGTITIRNENANIQGNVTLGDAATDKITFTGRVAQDSNLIPIGTSGTNSLGSASLPWDNIYVDNIYTASSGVSGHFQRANGALIPTNISDDLLLGATSTSSAKFGFLNVAGGNPTATISSNLSLVVPTGSAPASTLNLLNNGSLNIQRSVGGDAGLATIMYLQNDGNVGIGTTSPGLKLDIQDSQSATAAAQIFNTNTGTDADGLIIKLGNTSTTAVNANNHFVSFETAGIGIVGSIQGNGGKGITYATSGIADFAEYFKKDKDLTIEFGSVVCLNDKNLVVPCDQNNSKILGIASERPAFLGGENLGDSSIAVGLVGQVDTLVSISNGTVKAGDALSASHIPGVAVKATKAGQIVGKALENLDTINESKVVGYYDPDSKEYRSKAGFPDIPLKSNIINVVKINTSVNISWFDPGVYLANTGNLIINKDSNDYSITTSSNEQLTNSEGFFEIVSANIRGGLIKASQVITTSLIVTADTILVNGQNLKDYIADVVNELGIKNQELGTILPVGSIDKLSANIISPLGESLIVRLATASAEIHDSSFIIQNSSGSAVATINSIGDASFSGTLASENLEINNDASISGTLRTDRIIANNIEGLEKQNFSFLTSHLSSDYIDVASFSASLAYVPDLQAEQGLFNQGLMVFGPTSLSDLSIAGNLSIGGTMFVTENSIETLGTDLSLQSLRQGKLSIMGGLVYVDTQGNITTSGDLTVAGKLAVNVISPLPSSDLVINNASGSSVLSISKSGDVIASGSGTFAKLNFSLVAPVQAVSSTEVIASSSAGVANIAPYQAEVTIRNALVTDRSVIYITPVGTPSAQAPFLMRQIPQEPALSSPNGSFTVGVQSPTSNPIPFNWLIVN